MRILPCLARLTQFKRQIFSKGKIAYLLKIWRLNWFKRAKQGKIFANFFNKMRIKCVF